MSYPKNRAVKSDIKLSDNPQLEKRLEKFRKKKLEHVSLYAVQSTRRL